MNKDFEQSSGDEQMESQLWEYIDGLSGPEESAVIAQLVISQQVWKEKYEDLKSLHELMHAADLDQPSMRFAKNVMEEITRLQINPATRNYINKRVVWGIAGFFLATIIGFVIYSVGLIHWTEPVAPDPKYSVNLNPLPDGDFSRIFSTTSASVFMMVNIILALFLLDRYLANKRKKFSEEN